MGNREARMGRTTVTCRVVDSLIGGAPVLIVEEHGKRICWFARDASMDDIADALGPMMTALNMDTRQQQGRSIA